MEEMLNIYAMAYNKKKEWVRFDGVYVDCDGTVIMETKNGLSRLKPPYKVCVQVKDFESNSIITINIGNPS